MDGEITNMNEKYVLKLYKIILQNNILYQNYNN